MGLLILCPSHSIPFRSKAQKMEAHISCIETTRLTYLDIKINGIRLIYADSSSYTTGIVESGQEH
jgi:hypothetical protein